MGESVESVHLRGAAQKGVVSGIEHALRARGWTDTDPAKLDPEDLVAGVYRAFYVAPEQEGWVSFFPNRWDSEVVAEVSHLLSCPVLMLTLVEEGAFLYHFFHKGALVDTYKSDVGYLDLDGVTKQDQLAARADARALGPVLPAPEAADEIDRFLNATDKPPGAQLAEGLARILRIARWRDTYATLAASDARRECAHVAFRKR